MTSKNPVIKVALHGMDERSVRTMIMYLHGPCRGAAMVVGVQDADIDIFDADSVNGSILLSTHLEKKPQRPVLALSVHDKSLPDVVFIKKPVKTDVMLAALNATTMHTSNLVETGFNEVLIEPPKNTPSPSLNPPQKLDQEPLKKVIINLEERAKTSKHQTAMQLDEKGFNAFIGNISGVDVNDPSQFSLASYHIDDYFQGHVQSLLAQHRTNTQAVILHSGWKQLIIGPDSHEVWLDADEKQLRAFAALKLNIAGGAKITTQEIDPELLKNQPPEQIYSSEAFLWKLACWTSKGRYPDTIDLNQPVYLKAWPNFTRLLVTPHALRIAALLVQGPRTLANIAQVLDIKPQYVFVFISSAVAIGLAGQARRAADNLVELPVPQAIKNKGLLQRIISKLLAGRDKETS
jgi:hypothetical protein